MKKFNINSWRVIILGFIVINSNIVIAQQDVMYTQYMFNGLAINPAYAGSHDVVSTTALFRKQWLNVSGAPTSLSFTAHSPLPFKQMSAGILIVNDGIGINNETNVNLCGAYYIPVQGEKAKLSFGLQGGITALNSDFSTLSPDNLNDPKLGTSQISGVKPNVGAGVYYYSDKTYFGISLPRLLQNTFSNGNVTARKQSRHYFITGGHVIDIQPNYKLKPSFMIKAVSGAPVELDLNLNVLLMDRLWAGLSWRTFDSMDAIFQYNVNEKLSIGYAYDFTTTKLSQHTSGSHELMVNYLFKNDKHKVLTPRYF